MNNNFNSNTLSNHQNRSFEYNSAGNKKELPSSNPIRNPSPDMFTRNEKINHTPNLSMLVNH